VEGVQQGTLRTLPAAVFPGLHGEALGFINLAPDVLALPLQGDLSPPWFQDHHWSPHIEVGPLPVLCGVLDKSNIQADFG
jgi:hypothetical protein